MKQYRFLGNPAGYQWDFPLVPGRTYAGQLQAYHRHSLSELIEAAQEDTDQKFLVEWEEVANV